jgi:hypothetical protein
MPKFFDPKELESLDALTANNKVVLASLGGAPKLQGEAGSTGVEIPNADDEAWEEKIDV